MTTRSGILNWSLLADRGAAYLAGTSRSVRRGCERSHLLPGLRRRAQARLSSAERKHRTRRLILLGSYLEHVTGDDPGKRDSLMQGLNGFLERDRDRPLFDLPPKPAADSGK